MGHIAKYADYTEGYSKIQIKFSRKFRHPTVSLSFPAVAYKHRLIDPDKLRPKYPVQHKSDE